MRSPLRISRTQPCLDRATSALACNVVHAAARGTSAKFTWLRKYAFWQNVQSIEVCRCDPEAAVAIC